MHFTRNRVRRNSCPSKPKGHTGQQLRLSDLSRLGLPAPIQATCYPTGRRTDAFLQKGCMRVQTSVKLQKICETAIKIWRFHMSMTGRFSADRKKFELLFKSLDRKHFQSLGGIVAGGAYRKYPRDYMTLHSAPGQDAVVLLVAEFHVLAAATHK